MRQDQEPAENREEEALDELLLMLLAGRGERIAEVFRERSRRVALALELSHDGELQDAPQRRDDEGTALRVVEAEGSRRGHVSGPGDDVLRDLAGSLGGGDRVPSRAAPSPMPVEHGSEGLAARRFEEAASFLRDAARSEPRLARARLELQRDERSVQIASSEWGQSQDRRGWWRLALEIRLQDEDGRSAAAFRRVGWEERPRRGFGALVDELFDRANLDFDSVPIVPGAPTVVLAPGGGGLLFHEAVGHALEGDVASRAGTVLSGRLGELVAPEFVSVVDDPSLPGLAGSCRVDDEGVPGRPIALVDSGRVGEPLTDALRHDFEPARASGHGRRASHRQPTRPRMSNTSLLPGDSSVEELLAPVARGLFVERLEQGAFEPSTGEFRLRVAEARLVEDGRLGRPLRPFWLEGDTLALLGGIEELGGELVWDEGGASCGRDGQWLPVATGCPAVRIAEGILRVG